MYFCNRSAPVVETEFGSCSNVFALPETNMFAPKNGGFPIGISFSKGLCSGAMSVSFREGKYSHKSKSSNHRKV